MKRRNIIILILLIGSFGFWLTVRNTKSGTTDKSKTEFAIENGDLITKIYLYNKQQGHVTLQKTNGLWMVNGKYEASKPLMEFFIDETLKKIRVQGPVPLPARQNVIAAMATMACHTERSLLPMTPISEAASNRCYRIAYQFPSMISPRWTR